MSEVPARELERYRTLGYIMGTAREHGVSRLYNYQPRLDYLEDILRENHIHCSSSKNFNDPWDCKPCFDPSSLEDPKQRDQWRAYFEQLHADCPPNERAENVRDLGPDWWRNPTQLEKVIEGMGPSVWGLNAKNYRIFCLTTKPTSLLMWAHYADKHRGLCLEFDATAEKIWGARRVVYADRFLSTSAETIANSEKLVELSLLTKSTEWAYEEEYRVLGRDGKVDPCFSLATDGDFLRLPQGAITAVIAGSASDLDAVRSIIKRVKVAMPLKHAKRLPNEYRLEIVEVTE